MADRHALVLIGLLLGAATIVVTMVGAVVVNDHLSGKLQADDRVGAVSLPAANR